MSKDRKKQSRLAFTPLPSSSPASAAYPKQIRDRAASVRVEGSPLPAKKMRKLKDVTAVVPPRASDLDVTFAQDALPTPDLTNQTLLDESISDVDASRTSRQRMSSRKRMKQRKLDFDSSPPPASRQSINLASPIKFPSSKSSAPNPRAGFFGTQRTIQIDSSEDEEDQQEQSFSSDNDPTPVKKSSTRNKRTRSPSVHEESPPAMQQKPDEEDEDEDEDEDEEDVMPTTPAARRKRKQREPSTDDDKPAANSSPALVEDDEEGADDSDDVVVIASRTRGKRKPPPTLSDEDSPVAAPPSRKRLRRLNPISEEEKQDLEEDLRDLASSGSDTEIRPSQKKKKSAREEALDRLRRKRGGLTQEEPPNEDSNTEEDDDGYLGQPYEEDDNMDEEEEEEVLLPPKLARKHMFSRDEYDDDFVVEEEDDGVVGVPDSVPIEYTRYASMKAKDLFRYAIDWMVQKKINPAFPMNDEIYGLTFRKLDDEVKGLAGSKFVSAAWTPEFKFTLEARPDIEYARLDRMTSEHFLRDKCDACNRSGHPATYEVVFKGRPYDRETLEVVALSQDSDSDSGSSDSEADPTEGETAYDSKGRVIAPSDKVFFLGKFCMANAETAHSLSHWKWHLYEWVVDYLSLAGYLSPDKIVKRDSWSTRKRRKFGDKIVDAMEQDGKIKELYRDFKREIDSARDAKRGRFDSSP